MKRRLETFSSSLFVLLVLIGGSTEAQQAFRVEKDLLVEKQGSADAYYEVQTARALEDFQIPGETTRRPDPPRLACC